MQFKWRTSVIGFALPLFIGHLPNAYAVVAVNTDSCKETSIEEILSECKGLSRNEPDTKRIRHLYGSLCNEVRNALETSSMCLEIEDIFALVACKEVCDYYGERIRRQDESRQQSQIREENHQEILDKQQFLLCQQYDTHTPQGKADYCANCERVTNPIIFREICGGR
ncbi:MAG: hypothetical protein AB7P04_11525 [Bacteriovoracia bacterium]